MKRKRQNRKGVIGRAFCPLLAFVLAAYFVIGTPPLGGTAWAADPVDLDRVCSLEIIPVIEIQEDGSLEEVNVTLDLYMVAEAREVAGYDTYDYYMEPDSPYLGAALAYMDAHGERGWEYEADAEGGVTFRYSAKQDEKSESWDEVAQTVAAVIFSEGSLLEPVKTETAGRRMEDLEPGLYLVIARSEALTNKNDYVTELQDALNPAKREIATVAYTDSHSYKFLPRMLSLPAKEPEAEGGNANSANQTPWQYELQGIELKSVQEPRYASLEIVKSIDRYAAPASFVFQVEAKESPDSDRIIYSDVVTVSFDESSGREKSLLLADKIPAGSYVQVTEVYSGAVYSLNAISTDPAAAGEEETGVRYETNLGAASATVTGIRAGSVPGAVPGEDFDPGLTTRVLFNNVYNGSGNGGGSITNHFEPDEDGTHWNLYQYQFDGATGRWNWRQLSGGNAWNWVSGEPDAADITVR